MILRGALVAVAVCAAAAAKPVSEVDLNDTRVDVPWTEFRAILDKISGPAAARVTDTVFAPVNYLISSAAVTGAVADRKAARFNARLLIDVLPSAEFKANGWIAVPLGATAGERASSGIIERAYLDGKPIALESADGVLRLLVSAAGSHVVVLDYFCPVTSEEGSWKLAVRLPHAASASLDFLIPSSSAEIWLNGVKTNAVISREGTRLRTALSLESELSLRYSMTEAEQVEGAEGAMAPKVFASTGMLVSIKENRVDYQYRVDYQIWHQKRTAFAILLPESLSIENVGGAGLADWDITPTDSGPVLAARTSFAPDRAYSLTVNFSRKLETAAATVAVPVPRVLGVDRESGFLAVQATETMEVFVKDSVVNLTGVGARELPDWLQTSERMLMQFKYAKPPYALALGSRRHNEMPVLVAIADEALFSAVVTRDGYALAKFRYFIRNNHKQYLRLHMPAAWKLWSALIDGRAVMPASSDSITDVLIPLKKMSQTDEGTGFTLELVYWHEGRRLGLFGSIPFVAPVIDINCQQTQGDLWLPRDFAYGKTGGTLRKVTGYRSKYLSASTQERDADEYRSIPAQSNTFALSKQGTMVSLPVEIEIPQTGTLLRFTKPLTVAGEKTGVTVGYRFTLPWLRTAAALTLWAVVLLTAFAACRGALAEGSPGRAWPAALAGLGGLVTLCLIDAWLRLGAPALIRTAILGALLAFLSHLGKNRKEVAA